MEIDILGSKYDYYISNFKQFSQEIDSEIIGSNHYFTDYVIHLLKENNVDFDEFLDHMVLSKSKLISLLVAYIMKINVEKREKYYQKLHEVAPKFKMPDEDIILADEMNRKYGFTFYTVSLNNHELNKVFPILLKMLNNGSAQLTDKKLNVYYISMSKAKYPDCSDAYFFYDDSVIKKLYNEKKIENICFYNDVGIINSPHDAVINDDTIIMVTEYPEHKNILHSLGQPFYILVSVGMLALLPIITNNIGVLMIGYILAVVLCSLQL